MNQIKKIRELKRINQKSLAEAARISQPYLSDLEKNRRGARPETWQRIADALGCTIDELFEKNEASA